jgi:hypothetical protein
MAVNFKGGFTVLDKKGEYDGNMDKWKNRKGEGVYKTWRMNVFELNKKEKGLSKFYVCEKCDKRLKTPHTFHVHHNKDWFKFPKDRYKENNGVMLCITCHNEFKIFGIPGLVDEYLKMKIPKKKPIIKKKVVVKKKPIIKKKVVVKKKVVEKVKKLNKRQQKKFNKRK